MKISDMNQKAQMVTSYMNNVQNTQNNQGPKPEKADVPAGTDRVELSSNSRILQQVNKAVKAEDPQRAEHVKMIKEQVQNGTYDVDPEKVAQGMLKDLIKDMG